MRGKSPPPGPWRFSTMTSHPGSTTFLRPRQPVPRAKSPAPHQNEPILKKHPPWERQAPAWLPRQSSWDRQVPAWPLQSSPQPQLASQPPTSSPATDFQKTPPPPGAKRTQFPAISHTETKRPNPPVFILHPFLHKPLVSQNLHLESARSPHRHPSQAPFPKRTHRPARSRNEPTATSLARLPLALHSPKVSPTRNEPNHPPGARPPCSLTVSPS